MWTSSFGGCTHPPGNIPFHEYFAQPIDAANSRPALAVDAVLDAWRLAWLPAGAYGRLSLVSSLDKGVDDMTVAKVKCGKCGAEILAATAEQTGGICMPCAGGVSPSRLALARKQAGSVPSYTHRDVQAAVQEKFCEAQRTEALAYLDLHESAHDASFLARLQMAIIDLSHGDLERLVHYADYAYHVDYRDVLLWAESPTCRPTGA